MLIIGENINTSRSSIAEAVENRDAAVIMAAARAQARAGAQYIDVNAGTFREQEAECLCWLVETVQKSVDLPLCLDSADPAAMAAAIERHRGEPMINSISLERDRLEPMLEIIGRHPCQVIGLCIGAAAMPKDVADRIETARELIRRLNEKNVSNDRIYIDPLVQPVSVDQTFGLQALEAIQRISHEFAGVQTITGLSNISYGLPERRLINRTFLVLCLVSGLSAAILDPTDKPLAAALRAAEMLLGADEFCEKYLEAYYAGLLR